MGTCRFSRRVVADEAKVECALLQSPALIDAHQHPQHAARVRENAEFCYLRVMVRAML